MKVTGGATLHAPIETVWTALNDPAVLVRAIPGCERLQATGPDSYQLTVTAGVGSITGTYTGEISLSGRQPPTAFVLSAAGAGSPGTVSTSVRVLLAAGGDGATRLSYDADAQVGGMIAGVGQRMLAGVAKRQAAQFFTAVDDVLLARQHPHPQPAGPARHPAGAAPPEPGPPPGGAAGAAPPPPAPGQGGPGQLWEAPAAGRQPAGRWGAGHGFLPGVLVGAAVALAGVAAGGFLGRRSR